MVNPTDVVAALRRSFDLDSSAVAEGEEVRLDTPYLVGHGYGLRAYLAAVEGGIRVTDGGFASQQIETYVRNQAGLRSRYRELARLAEGVGLTWDGELSYVAPDLESAVRRLKILAQVVQEGQALAAAGPARPERNVARSLAVAVGRLPGFKVRREARIEVPGRGKPVLVDLEVQRNLASAAVEVLAGRSDNGLQVQVDHAVANLHTLANGEYQGLLFAVFDEQSRAGDKRFREQFNAAKPPAAELLASEEAALVIQRRLAA